MFSTITFPWPEYKDDYMFSIIIFILVIIRADTWELRKQFENKNKERYFDRKNKPYRKIGKLEVVFRNLHKT